ncbi:IS701 family transposase [Streptomyces montanisoli]|uniref:Transposase n=1 Tax=Streptomyces montanisoli TaxID=2798581 RepID=A0A940MCR9_9ACTN|nr:transposase [Streptomyces montanisoli]MBP0456303.1 transposase [Streptomyces montanisoli]
MTTRLVDAANLLPQCERESFREFSRGLFYPLPRADQRKWAEVYLAGLLTLQGRKSIRRMAEQYPGWSADRAAQSLQQFVNQSPWDWSHITRALADWVTSVSRPQAWVVDTAVIPKRGAHSVGVARRRIAGQSRPVNSQFALGGFIATRSDALPVEWQLVLEQDWTSDHERKARARIPPGSTPRPLWRNVLEACGGLGRPGIPLTLPVVTDLRCESGVDRLISALCERGHQFLIGATAPSRRGARPTAAGLSDPFSGPFEALDGFAEAPARILARQVADHGMRTRRRTRLLAHQVRLPGAGGGSTGVVYRQLDDGDGGEGLVRYWVTNNVHLGPNDVMALIGHLQRAKGCVRLLAEEFGMSDFEGRSFPGWHHHMALVSAAGVYSLTGAGFAARRASQDRMPAAVRTGQTSPAA